MVAADGDGRMAEMDERPRLDVFAALRSGLSFDRRRFGADMRVFEPAAAAGRGPAAGRPAAGRDEDDEQDEQDDDAVATEEEQEEDDEGGGVQMHSASTLARAAAAGSARRTAHLTGSQKRARRAAAAAAPLAERARRAAEIAQEEANAARRRLRIRVTGGAAPAPLESFACLQERYHVPGYLLRSLEDLALGGPTPIQAQAVPALLEGSELLAVAPTGSGKTFAFLLPLLARLGRHAASGPNPRAVVLCPTRELAAQSLREMRLLTQGRRLRGRTLSKATAAAGGWDAVDVLFATPLRLAHLLASGAIDLSSVEWLVLDEADKLFELGFVEQIDEVIAACTNPAIRRALFSATLPEAVEELARSVLAAPLRIVVGERHAAAPLVDQKMLFVGREEAKLWALRQMAREGGLKPPALVFVESKERAQQLYRELAYDGLRLGVIHADLSQAKRDAAVASFRAGDTWVLIATDLLGRGIDFKGVATVVNFDFPKSTAAYIHRVGRTGRAGLPGSAVTFFTEEDAASLRSIANVMQASGCEVPAWMLKLKKVRNRNRKRPRPGDAGVEEEEEGGGAGDGAGGSAGAEPAGTRAAAGAAGGGPRKARPGVRASLSTEPLTDQRKRQRRAEMIEGSKRRKSKEVSAAAVAAAAGSNGAAARGKGGKGKGAGASGGRPPSGKVRAVKPQAAQAAAAAAPPRRQAKKMQRVAFAAGV